MSSGCVRAVRLLLAVLLLAAPHAGQNRAWPFDVVLRGPLEGAVFDFEGEGSVRVTGSLLAGEELELTLPAPVRSPLGREGLEGIALPRPRIEGEGTVDVRGWRPPDPAADPERLPREWRRRSPPAVSGAVPHATWSGLALLAVAFLLGLAWRRTRIRGPATAIVLGGIILVVTAGEAPVPGEVRVLEGGGGSWWEVHAARDRLEARELAWLEVVPEGRAVELEVRLDGPRTIARSPGAVLTRIRPLDPPAGPDPELFGRGAPEATWLRSAGGELRPRGTWRWGEGPPPPPAEPAPDPPGWLMTGLPQGVEVLLGRLEAAEGESWLRVTGQALASGNRRERD